MFNKDLINIPAKVNMINSIELIEYHPVVTFRKKMEIIRFTSNPLAHNLHKI